MTVEKDMWMRKANNFKKSPLRSSFASPTNSGAEGGHDLSDDDNGPMKLDSKKIYNNKQVIDDINSDIDNQSAKYWIYFKLDRIIPIAPQ